MDVLSAEVSPTSSASPPMMLFPKIVHGTHVLPPLKTLPAWNRTKLQNKAMCSVSRNPNIQLALVGTIGKTEAITQTTPPTSAGSFNRNSSQTSSRGLPEIKTGSANKVRRTYEKRILFIQSNHQHVLVNLQRELEKLKVENKALQFQLIMAGGGLERNNPAVSNTNIMAKKPVMDPEIESGKVEILQKEVVELKKSLHEVRSTNIELNKLIEERTERSLSIKPNEPNIFKVEPVAGGNNHPSVVTSVENSYEDTIKELKLLTSKQQSDLLLLKDKLQEQKISGRNFVLPKLDGHKRSARLSAKSSTFERNTNQPKTRNEPVSFPVLQPCIGSKNLTLRQKRAQALHVQRQRSNKDISLLLR